MCRVPRIIADAFQASLRRGAIKHVTEDDMAFAFKSFITELMQYWIHPLPSFSQSFDDTPLDSEGIVWINLNNKLLRILITLLAGIVRFCTDYRHPAGERF